MLLTILVQNVMIPVVPPTPTTDNVDGFRRKRHIVEQQDERLKRLKEDDEIFMQTAVNFVINLN